MKFLMILSMFLIVACATKPENLATQNLQYEKTHALLIGSSTEADIIKIFGLPTGKTESKGYYVLRYDDPKTGSQRLSASFLSDNGKLAEILWLPQENEAESALEQAKAGFKNAVFKVVNEDNYNPHALSAGSVFYIDEKQGVTIRYNRSQKTVEGIAIYHANTRIPAEQKPIVKGPYILEGETKNSN